MIDVSTFGVTLPAGTYTKGDTVQLKSIDGPAVVRSGRGSAILKRITSLIAIAASGSASNWKVSVKNSDWIDPAISMTAPLDNPTVLDPQSGAIQSGQDCPLNPNSSWEITAECMGTVTTTIDNSIICILDIDYPSVSSIIDPKNLQGFPTTIIDKTTVDLQVADIEAAGWTSHSVDIFKAGYEYALVKAELKTGTNAAQGLVKISDAAGMQGLTRVIPTAASTINLRNNIEYASKLVKGPMTISYLLFSGSGVAVTGSDCELIIDFVKRKV